jgi:large subunit ribosomal protein L10
MPTETGRDPRPEKVAVVDEVRERLDAADAAVLTDYRGIDVAAMAELRRALTAAGGEFKIYKNTLVRFAVRELGLDIEDLLTGPTAIAFVPPKEDGTPGDAVTVAKALKDFAKTNEHLVLKGGLLGDKTLTADEISALADVAPREVLLARLAGGMAAPMVHFAGLLKAVPSSFAYALSALIEAGGGPDAPAPEPVAAAEPEPEPEPEAEAPAEPVAEAAANEAPETDADAPAGDETKTEDPKTEDPKTEDPTTENTEGEEG